MLMNNSFPIQLNFLLFLRNLSLSNEEEVFPWFPIDRSIFLQRPDFDVKVKELWNSIFDSCQDDCIDNENWYKHQYSFDVLFRNSSYAEKYLPMIKKSYSVWFMTNWKPIVELYSRQIVERYYNILTESGREHPNQPVVPSITLEIVYIMPPDDWVWHNQNRLVLSCASDIISRKKIVEQLEAMCFGTN